VPAPSRTAPSWDNPTSRCPNCGHIFPHVQEWDLLNSKNNRALSGIWTVLGFRYGRCYQEIAVGMRFFSVTEYVLRFHEMSTVWERPSAKPNVLKPHADEFIGSRRIQRMNGIWFKISCLTAGCLLLSGCNGGESLENSFRNASFSTREQVEEAVRLDRANNYLRAAQHYDTVLRSSLTSQQRSSVEAAISKLFDRMCKAAAQGDREAKQTLESIEGNQQAQR